MYIELLFIITHSSRKRFWQYPKDEFDNVFGENDYFHVKINVNKYYYS